MTITWASPKNIDNVPITEAMAMMMMMMMMMMTIIIIIIIIIGIVLTTTMTSGMTKTPSTEDDESDVDKARTDMTSIQRDTILSMQEANSPESLATKSVYTSHTTQQKSRLRHRRH